MTRWAPGSGGQQRGGWYGQRKGAAAGTQHATPRRFSNLQPAICNLQSAGTVLLWLGLFLLALAPRVLAAGEFMTADEARFWFGRAERFLLALQQGEYAGTNQVGHPGVTTMWLGAMGIQAYHLVVDLGLVASHDPAAYRLMLRLPIALVTALSVTLAYPLLRRLLDPRVALLAALLWATDPFLVAHGQVLHLDALLTSFVTLALLAALLALFRPAPSDQRAPTVAWGWLAASALAGGLAFLTKSPSVILLPMLGLIALGGSWRMQPRQPERAIVPVLARTSRVLLVWGGIALGTWVLLWPAAWVDPYGSLMSIVRETLSTGGSLHSWGNFFLGEPVADPGPLFYPLAIAFRLTPWTSLGLLLALAALVRAGWNTWRTRSRSEYAASGGAEKTVPATGSTALLFLALFVLMFVLMVSLSPKKFDRYALPIFPALNILAAWGWVWLLARLPWVGNLWRAPGEPPATQARGFGAAAVRVLVVAGLVANLAWYHPYAIAYYNPLLGGGPVAQRTLFVGWGEGLEQAGAYISQQFNGCDRPVAAWYEFVLGHFVCTDTVPLRNALLPGNVDYVVLYVNQLQRGIDWETTTLVRGLGPPLHTVQIHGITYAHVYQIPQPVVSQPLAADFGPAMRFQGYAVDTSAVRSTGVLSLTVQWQARAPIDTDYMLFVHVLDEQGQIVGQTDVPPGDPRAPTSTWQRGQSVYWVHPVPLPSDLPPGTYWLALGVYDPHDFARLPVDGPRQPGAPDDGPGALLLEPVVIR